MNGVSQVDGYSDLASTCACRLCVCGAQQRNKIAKIAAPPALTLKSDHSVFPCMSLVLFLFLSLPKDMLTDFREREGEGEREKERERERNIDVREKCQQVASPTRPGQGSNLAT